MGEKMANKWRDEQIDRINGPWANKWTPRDLAGPRVDALGLRALDGVDAQRRGAANTRGHARAQRVPGEHHLLRDFGFQTTAFGFLVDSFGIRNSGIWVSDLVCSVQGSGFRVQGLGFRVWGLGLRVHDSGFRVQGSGFRV